MKDYKLDLEIEFAIHLADLHIYNEDGGIISRQDEYEQVFKNLIIDIKNNKKIKKNNTIIYIAGDIFDAARREKGRTTSTAVTLFKNLISKLSKLGVVVIIPGNHDNNITYKSKEDHTITDTLTGVLEGINGMDSNICYLNATARILRIRRADHCPPNGQSNVPRHAYVCAFPPQRYKTIPSSAESVCAFYWIKLPS